MYQPEELKAIDGMDIYLIDQIQKGRYIPGQSILDAGAGGGRNLNWFFQHKFNITACDADAERRHLIESRYPDSKFNWATCDLAELPFEDASFDHIICSAVLHFARDEQHFDAMWNELVRVLKAGVSLFIRTCSEIGIEQMVNPLGGKRFHLPDDSERFLLDREMIKNLLLASRLAYLEPLKSVNVDDQRVMSTLVLVKQR